MCGRYAITLPPEAIRQWFGYVEQPNFPPRFNIAPTQPIPIVCRDPLAPGDATRHFKLVRWGLLPSFVKDVARFPLLINARSEAIVDKPSFRAAMMRRRCVVIADGYYEWRRASPREPGTPFLISRADRAPIAFGGLWDSWMGADGSEMDTACIITTASEGLTAAIHPRMPVMIEHCDMEAWMDADRLKPREALRLLRPAADHLLTVVEVSPAVNKVANDGLFVQEPVGRPGLAPPAARQGRLF